jgi:predicted acetyltransferase
MNSTLEYGPMIKETEEAPLRDILTQCFDFPVARWQAYMDLAGPENFRVVRRDGRVVGGLLIIFMGQWFGGRAIPMGGIAAVGVPPEQRGSGIARTLMARTLLELREQEIPLSTLYASTQHLYRGVGYEQAGTFCLYAMAASAFPGGDRSLRVEPVDASKHEIFHAMYREWATPMNGMLARNRTIWERAVRPDESPVFGYRIGEPDSPVGYLIYSQQSRDQGHDMKVRDWAALTPAAHARLQTLLADHRSVVNDIVWKGPPVDPLLCAPEEQRYKHRACERWMVRIVDVQAALGQRGYPEGVEARLDLEITDDLVPGNSGRFILDVSGGRGTVRAGGGGDLRCGVRGLAPLYSSMLVPQELARIGWIEGDASALATAARIFAGPQPWMSDGF